MADTDVAPLGHNMPPKTVKEDLSERYATELARLSTLSASCDEAPTEITDDVVAGQVGDLLKMVRVAVKAADGAREIEKEPHMTAGKEVDATFKVPINALEAKAIKVKARLTDYLERKKKREEDARRAEAERVRKLAEDQAREAALAQERRVAAEEAARNLSAAEEEARGNTDEMEQRKLDAMVALARAKSAKAQARRDKNEEATKAAELAIETAEAEITAAKSELKAKREEQKRLADQAAEAERTAAAARKTERQEQSEAKLVEGQASRAERRADNLTAADASRVRSEDLGTVSSLRKKWVFTVKDAAAVPPLAVWPFLTQDEIGAAIARAVRSGVRTMPGVLIEEEPDTGTV